MRRAATLTRSTHSCARIHTHQVSYNKIVSVPAELGRLSGLSELQLTCNQIETLPPELGRTLPPRGAMTELGLSSNPLRAPLSQIVLRGTAAALRYLREQLPPR